MDDKKNTFKAPTEAEIDAKIRNADDLGTLQARGQRAAINALASDDGVAGMFGIPPMVRQVLGVAFSAGSLFLGIGARGQVEKWSSKAFNYLPGVDQEKAEALGQKAKTGFMFLAPAIPELLGAFNVGRNHFRQMRKQEALIKDVLVANKKAGSGATNITSSKNLILRSAYGAVNAETNNGIKKLLASAMDLLPNWFVAFSQHKIDKLENEKKLWKRSQKFTDDYEERLGAAIDSLQKNKRFSRFSDEALIKLAEKKIAGTGINGNEIDDRIEELRSQQKTGVGASLLANAGGQGGKGMLQQKYEEVDKNTSYAMCLEFDKYVAGQMRNMTDGGERVKNMLKRDLDTKIAKIFAKVRAEYNMPELTDLMREQLAGAVEMIAEKIASGEIHPKALINLAGETRIMQRNAIANTEQVEEELKVQAAKMSPQAMEGAKAFTGRVGVSLRDIIKSYKNMDKQEKLLFGMLMPDSVLRMAGMKTAQIREVRAEVEPEINHYFACAIMNIAAADTQMLREAGVPDRDIDAFRQMASDIAAHNNLEATHFGPAVEKMILNAGMKLEKSNPEAWKNIFDSDVLAKAQAAQAEEKPQRSFSEEMGKRRKHEKAKPPPPEGHVKRSRSRLNIGAASPGYN